MKFKSVLVTGGAGSFGSAFVKKLLDDNLCDRVCVFSRGEHRQSALKRQLNDSRARFFIGDIRDLERLETAMHGVDLVVHAAALKDILSCEYNCEEAVKTNVLGSMNINAAARRAGVKRVMLISTDKAAASNTLYGATKFAAERATVAANVMSPNGTQYSAVRYGNVEGSAGSVIPLFKQLVAEGANSLPITDERMTRFFWSIDDAVEFTLSSIEMMAGGEVFIPKIKARRIVDVAREVAPDLPHRFVGIRPNEKLHEILISEDESRNAVELPDRYVLCPPDPQWDRSHLVGAKKVAEDFVFGSEFMTV